MANAMVLSFVHIIPYLVTARKRYLIVLLFMIKHKLGDFGPISVTESSCDAPLGQPHEVRCM